MRSDFLGLAAVEVLRASYSDLAHPCWDLPDRAFPGQDRPAASDLVVVDPNSAASSAVDIRQGPFPVASEDHPGAVRVAVEDLAILGRVVPSVVPSAQDAVGLGDVAACAVVEVLVVLLRVVLACGEAEVAPEDLPVPAVVHSCAGVVREDSEVEGHRVAGEGDLASACGHLVHPAEVPVDHVDGAVPGRVPYAEGLAVAQVAEAGTDCAATGKGRDSATVVPSGSEPVAAASDC